MDSVLASRCRQLAIVFALALLWGIFPLEAAAQTAFPSNVVLDQVINYFYNFSAALNDRISPWAGVIFSSCATIQAALFLWNIMLEEISRRSLSSGGVRGLLKKLLTYTLFISLTGWILANDGYITGTTESYFINGIAPWVLQESCYQSSGTYANPIGAGEIVQLGWWTFEQTNENVMMAVSGGQFSDTTNSGNPVQTTDSWWDFNMLQDAKQTIDSFTGTADWLLTLISTPEYWVVYLAALLIIPTYYVIAFQVIITEISLALLGGFMPIFLAFMPLTFFSPLISGYVRYYLYTLFKLFFIYLLLVPVLQLPGILISGTSTKTLTSNPSPIAQCSAPLLTGPNGFDINTGPTNASGPQTRADLALTLAAFALASASLLKTVPERLASYVTQRFTLRPLYNILD